MAFSSAIASEAERDDSRTAVIAVGRLAARPDAFAGEFAGLAAGAGGLPRRLGGGIDGLGHLGGGLVAPATMRSWASAPVVISAIAPAISATARPASSEVRVTPSEDSLTVFAVATTSPIIRRRLTVIRRSAWPSASSLRLRLDVDGQVAVGDPPAGLLDLAQVADHVLERGGGGPELAADADVDVLVEVAGGDPAGAGQQAARGAHERLRHREADERGEQRRRARAR